MEIKFSTGIFNNKYLQNKLMPGVPIILSKSVPACLPSYLQRYCWATSMSGIHPGMKLATSIDHGVVP
jgi:hypothetical protein